MWWWNQDTGWDSMTDINFIISLNGGTRKTERDIICSVCPYMCQNNLTTAFCLLSPLGNKPLGHTSHFTNIVTCQCMLIPHRCFHKVISASTKNNKNPQNSDKQDCFNKHRYMSFKHHRTPVGKSDTVSKQQINLTTSRFKMKVVYLNSPPPERHE